MSELSTRKGIGDWLRKRIVGVTHMVRRKVLAVVFAMYPRARSFRSTVWAG